SLPRMLADNVLSLFFYSHSSIPNLHSFPTRRSSDLHVALRGQLQYDMPIYIQMYSLIVVLSIDQQIIFDLDPKIVSFYLWFLFLTYVYSYMTPSHFISSFIITIIIYYVIK